MSDAPTSKAADPPFGAPTLEQLTSLVFELASQLHAERAHRIALEGALEAVGVLPAGAADAAAGASPVRSRTLEALDRGMAGMTRVMTEDVDLRRPLRRPSQARDRAVEPDRRHHRPGSFHGAATD